MSVQEKAQEISRSLGEEQPEQGQEAEQHQEDDAPAVEMPQVSEHEVKARSTGWVSKEEWIEQGNHADDWVSAKRYNEKGELINKIKTLEKDFTKRISANNDVWKARLEQDREELLKRRDDAIDVSDRKAVHDLDGKIQQIDKQVATLDLSKGDAGQGQQMPQAAPPPPEDLAKENQYFSQLTRAQQSFAKDVAVQYVQQGLSGEALVQAVHSEVSQEFPQMNPRRNTASKTDTGRKPAPNKNEVTIDNLSNEDKMALNALKRSSTKYSKMSSKELLNVIKDTKL